MVNLVFRPFDRGGKKIEIHISQILLKSKGTTLDFILFDKNQRVLPLDFIKFIKNQRVLPLDFIRIDEFSVSTFLKYIKIKWYYLGFYQI